MPKRHEQSFPSSLQEHSKYSKTYFQHNSSLWRWFQAFVHVYWQEVVFHCSDQEGDDGGKGGGMGLPKWLGVYPPKPYSAFLAHDLASPATHHPAPLASPLLSVPGWTHPVSFSRRKKTHWCIKVDNQSKDWCRQVRKGGEVSVIQHGSVGRGRFVGAPLFSLALESKGEAQAPISSPGVRLCWGAGQHSRIIPFRNLEA